MDDFDHEEHAIRAYFLWESEDYPDGRDVEHWFATATASKSPVTDEEPSFIERALNAIGLGEEKPLDAVREEPVDEPLHPNPGLGGIPAPSHPTPAKANPVFGAQDPALLDKK